MTIFIYGLLDPRIPDTIFYVGQTGQLSERISAHFKGRDRATKQWVKDLLSEGISPTFKLLETTTEFKALATESRLINEHGPKLNTKTVSTAFRFEVSPIVSLRDMEAKYLRWSLDFFGGNKQATARALGIGRQTLYNKLKILGVS